MKLKEETTATNGRDLISEPLEITPGSSGLKSAVVFELSFAPNLRD